MGAIRLFAPAVLRYPLAVRNMMKYDLNYPCTQESKDCWGYYLNTLCFLSSNITSGKVARGNFCLAALPSPPPSPFTSHGVINGQGGYRNHRTYTREALFNKRKEKKHEYVSDTRSSGIIFNLQKHFFFCVHLCIGNHMCNLE